MALKSEQLFNLMEKYINEKGADEIVKKVKAVFFFEISAKKGEAPKIWTVDLKTGTGINFLYLIFIKYLYIKYDISFYFLVYI